MKVESNNGKVTNYKTFGDKLNTPIMLIHGLGANITSWNNQIEEFQKKDLYVITLDMYGHGESSDLSNSNLNEWNIQILELINHLNLDKIILCGVSMGGVISQYFTIKYPDKIIALIISDSFCELKTLSEKILGKSQIIGFTIYKFLGKKIFAKAMASVYKDDFAVTAQKYMYKQSLQANFTQLLIARKAINCIDVKDKIKKLRIPCLVIVGKNFGNFFVKINKKIANSIPNAQFVELENSMDPSPLVNATMFNNEVLLFLKNNNI